MHHSRAVGLQMTQRAHYAGSGALCETILLHSHEAKLTPMAQQYRPLYKLDSGGMAEVYVAEAISLAGFKKKVAIKRILPGLLTEDRFVRMFLDEARLSLRLSHANIVPVFDIGKTDNTYFIVMEYVEGTTVRSLMQHVSRQQRAMPVPLAIWMINEILKGLQYAHTLTDPETGRCMNIVHRDISPPNILVSWSGEVKLTDFGLAKATTQLESTDPGVVKGKFAYLSPEAARGEAVDHRTDVFAVGILLFEMLSGRRLFLGKSDWETVELVRRAEVPDLRQINPDIPDRLQEIICKALALDIRERYASAGDFADDLIGVLFAHQMRVSARDLTETLQAMRRSKDTIIPGHGMPGPVSNNLILDLMNEELSHFQSIEDLEHDSGTTQPAPSANSPGHAKTLLVEEMPHDDGYDPSQPLDLGLEDLPPQAAANEVSPAPTPPQAHGNAALAAQAVAAPDLGLEVRTQSGARPVTHLGDPLPSAEVDHARRPKPIRERAAHPVLWTLLLLVLVAGGGAALHFELIPADLGF